MLLDAADTYIYMYKVIWKLLLIHSIFNSIQAEITGAGGAVRSSARNPWTNGATTTDGEEIPWWNTATASKHKKYSGRNSARARRWCWYLENVMNPTTFRIYLFLYAQNHRRIDYLTLPKINQFWPAYLNQYEEASWKISSDKIMCFCRP